MRNYWLNSCVLVAVITACMVVSLSGKIGAKQPQPISQGRLIMFFSFENEMINLKKVYHKSAPYTPSAEGGTWKVELLSDKNQVLFEKNFIEPEHAVLFWDVFDPETGEISEGGQIEQEAIEFSLILPYFQNAKRLKIYRQQILDTPEPKVKYQLINTVQLPPRETWEVMP